MPTAPLVAARTLKQLLEAEGAFFHHDIAPRAMPSMGGGVGVVATSRRGLRSATTIATLPFRCMITTKKARLNLAMAEVAIAEARTAASSTSSTTSSSSSTFSVPFTAHIWSGEEETALEAAWGSPRFRAVRLKIDELERKLSPTDTIVCYVLLLACLYGRWQPNAHLPITSAPITLSFTHENAWMRTWILALPARYDNLLELQPAATASTTASSPSPSSAVASGRFLDQYVPFARQQDKTRTEQKALCERFQYCRGLLASLTHPIVGVEETPSPSTVPTTSSGAAVVDLSQFRWAFNTLMSRGFAFEEDVWAMMPWVDYFNYALLANGTMGWSSLPSSAAAGQNRRGRSRAFTAAQLQSPNAYQYNFELTQPVRGGSQVYLHYGAYSDFELLQWYGFRLGGFLLPTALMQEVVPTPPVTQDAADSHSLLFNPLLHAWMDLENDDTRSPSAEGNEEAEQQQEDEGSSAVRALFTNAIHRQSVLERFLPVLVHATTRASAFEIFWAAQEAQHRLDADAVCGEEDQEAEEDEEGAAARKEWGYDEWCQATQRACSYALSPYADTDGDYPPIPADGQTWIHQLFAGLLRTPAAHFAEPKSAAAQSAAQTDQWARAFAQHMSTAIGADGELLADAQGKCFLGSLGRSQRLASALDRIVALLMANPKCWDLLPDEAVKVPRFPRKAHLQRQLVRAIAWAELYTNWTRAPVDVEHDEALATSPRHLLLACENAEIAEMTFDASCDAWALLRFLALEASDEALDEYVEYEDAYYG